MDPKEFAEVVAKVVSEIRKAEVITDEIIRKTSLKYNVSDFHIRKVAGYFKTPGSLKPHYKHR